MWTVNGNVSDCSPLLRVTNFNDLISRQNTQNTMTALLFRDKLHSRTSIKLRTSSDYFHRTFFFPILPNLRPDILLVCYVFDFHISSAFPFSRSPLGSKHTVRKFAGLRIPNNLLSCSSYPSFASVFVLNIRISGREVVICKITTTNASIAAKGKNLLNHDCDKGCLTLYSPFNSQLAAFSF